MRIYQKRFTYSMTLQTKVWDMNGDQKTDHEGAAFYKPLKRPLELSRPRVTVLFLTEFWAKMRKSTSSDNLPQIYGLLRK